MTLDLKLSMTVPMSCPHVGHTFARSAATIIMQHAEFIERGYARHMNFSSGMAGKMSHAIKPPRPVPRLTALENGRHMMSLSGLAGDVARYGNPDAATLKGKPARYE